MSEDRDALWLRRAISLSADNIASGHGGPFGAVVVREGRVIGEGANQVLKDHDPTAHAEVVAIRRACAAIASDDLKGAVLYTSCEPCPMCLAAAYWAGIGRIVWANSRQDAQDIGFGDALIYREISVEPHLRRIAGTQMLAQEGRAVFLAWKEKNPNMLYGPDVPTGDAG